MTLMLNPTEADWEEISAFKFPHVEFMDLVQVFGQGDTSSSPKEAIVTRIDDKGIVMRMLSADQWLRPTDSCRHKDDPELRFKPGLRQKGTWDLHPKEKSRRQHLQWLEDRIKKLEQLSSIVAADKQTLDSAEPPAPQTPPAVTRSKEYWKKTSEVYESDIVELSSQGKSATEIAQFLGAGWTPQRIGLILSKAKEKLAEVA